VAAGRLAANSEGDGTVTLQSESKMRKVNVPAVALQTLALAGEGRRSALVCESSLSLLCVCEGCSVRSPAPAGRRRKLERTGSVGPNAAEMFSPVFFWIEPPRKKCITPTGPQSRSLTKIPLRYFR
jgi:hypothetical protein